ncbi:MAG: YfiR family protein [Planctomycetota bacterium]
MKAAFIYNFLKFVDWPEGKKAKNSQTLVIGVLGEEPYKTIRTILQDKTAQGFKIDVVQIKKEDLDHVKDVGHCDALFFSATVKCDTEEIVKQLGQYQILTISEKEGFLEDGGMINIFIKDKKVYFEINKGVLEKSRLKLRSKMLRLAKKIIEDEDK